MRLLLHACCGPCLIEPLDEFSASADELAIVFTNSNIHPAEEYERRRRRLLAYADGLGATVVELDYDPAAWVEAVGPLARSGAERCRACYRLRLGEAARYAAENGYDALATTLTISPYQSPDAIREEGQAAAAQGRHRVGRPRLPRLLPRGDAPLARAGHVPPELLRVRALRRRGSRAGASRAGVPRGRAAKAARGGQTGASATRHFSASALHSARPFRAAQGDLKRRAD